MGDLGGTWPKTQAAEAERRGGLLSHEDAIMQQAMFERVNAMERFGRLTTDLANERTLLAYVRTTLAAIRTSFAYVDMSLHDASLLWRATVLISEFLMTSLIMVTAYFGANRYYKLKDVIMQKVPPKHFGRISLRPLNLLVIVATASTAVGVYVQAWK